MLSESTVVDGSATESTVYGYTGTQQTSKTVTDNTTSSVTSALNYTYDLQGRMSRAVTVAGNRTSDVSYLYGTDGIRISAREDVTENGSTSTRITNYLIDAQNHTGYQQVLQETITDGTGNLIQKIVYTIGHDHISQSTWRAADVSPPSVAVFHFDGHGNTRILTDLAGSIVTLAGLLQVYHYDAYGNALNFTMSAAATQYLYSGEQFDPRIGQQYLRARYYDSATGTFNRLDPFFGNTTDPQSFHKYLYTHGDPVNGIDPTGMFTIAGLISAMGNLSVAQGRESSKTSSIGTAHHASKTFQAYQKVLELANKAQDLMEWVEELYDILSFDPSDIADLVGQMGSFSSIVGSLAEGIKKDVEVEIPKKMWRKFADMSNKIANLLGHIRAQEIMGELGTALMINILGFEQGGMTWSASQGPDQVARQEQLGVWGIFEAKGGNSGLGTSTLGGGPSVEQMSGKWIGHWIDKYIVPMNSGALRNDLKDQFDNKNLMLASIVRVHMTPATAYIKITAQAFKPKDGSGMSDWGNA